MQIRRKDIIDKFIEKHVDSKNALQRWIEITEKSIWESHADIKFDFPSADYVGKGKYVFNIRGNHYRLIVVVIFVLSSVTVDFVGTHKEYDKLKL
jgi:mRNA interferase HigB